MLTAGRLGVHVAVATPEGYEPNAEIVAQAVALGARSRVTNDPAEALAGARRRLHRRVGQHGAGVRGQSPRRRVRSLPGE